jgi:hypothetical protein
LERGVEALLLGLSVGLVCLASCGAVLLPWLVVQQRTTVATAWLLGQVLAGRLVGYLLFAGVAWAAGLVLVPGELRTRALVFGLAHVALAAMLFWYVFAASRSPRSAQLSPGSRRLSPMRRRISRVGPAALGFLTGINLCPPFVVATVRAAELRSLPASLAFFTVFFVGTSVWFLPFLAAGAARRIPEARTVGRVAMGIVAAYYGYMGAITLGWRLMYG